ncbi:hypothetical protein HLH17_06760 [Acinetobacter sp. ANC 5380]|uniref:DUF4148 domain-containing protein n=1 Tax=Acinetobacter terrae TaxID=2731247 RepID=A0A7Y2WAN2_9GAMM|nr:hypothetical protein [Acinetobacter terrae]NNH77374.1 hypothetical protein [Acinetobacter terrae]
MKKITLILAAMLSASTFAAETKPYPTEEEVKAFAESWTFPLYYSIAEQLVEDGLKYQEEQQKQQKQQAQKGEKK